MWYALVNDLLTDGARGDIRALTGMEEWESCDMLLVRSYDRILSEGISDR